MENKVDIRSSISICKRIKEKLQNLEFVKKHTDEKILEILSYENRNLNIRELSELLRTKHKISRSPPIIKKYVEELSKEGKLIYEDGKKN